MRKDQKIEEIDISNFEGQCQRDELLVLLKDKAVLKHKEISEFDIFGDLNFI